MKISLQRKIFSPQDKSLSVSGIITGHKIMKSQVYRLVMAFIRKYFRVWDLINNNDPAGPFLRWIDTDLLDLVHAPEDLIFKIEKFFMDTKCFFHIYLQRFGK